MSPQKQSRRGKASPKTSKLNTRWPRLNITRTLRPIQNEFHCVQAVESLGVIASSASVPTFVSFPVSLSGFDQNAQLAAVFDQYKIIEIEYQFLPRYQYETSGSFTAYNPGVFHSVVDTTDNVALTTIAAALDYPTVKAWAPGRSNTLLTQRFNPQCVVTSTSDMLSSGDQWFSTNLSTLGFNGVKTAWTVTSSVLTMDCIVRAHLAFRMTR
jgi:hypothetical protein